MARSVTLRVVATSRSAPAKVTARSVAVRSGQHKMDRATLDSVTSTGQSPAATGMKCRWGGDELKSSAFPITTGVTDYIAFDL